MHMGAQISTQGSTLYVCLSKSLHVFVFMSLYLSVAHSFTAFGIVPADQVRELETGHFKSFVGTLNQSGSR